jgi:Entner-Doudoroff aldolase
VTGDFDEILGGCPVMAILRGFTVERTLELAHVAWDLGITCVEIPVQSPASAQALAATVRAAGDRPVWTGAGTITSIERLDAAAAAGAHFTVAPGLDPAVAAASAQRGMPHLPGVCTPTDVQRALALGMVWLKAFPASVLTPAWVAAMRGPFPEARFVATGGVDADNAQEFLDAGCRAVAVGSALASAGALPALAALVAR